MSNFNLLKLQTLLKQHSVPSHLVQTTTQISSFMLSAKLNLQKHHSTFFKAAIQNPRASRLLALFADKSEPLEDPSKLLSFEGLILRLAVYGKLEQEVLVYAASLVSKFIEKYTPQSVSVNRLFTPAVYIAQKMLNDTDHWFSNNFGQICQFRPEMVRLLEAAFSELLEFKLHVTQSEHSSLIRKLSSIDFESTKFSNCNNEEESMVQEC